MLCWDGVLASILHGTRVTHFERLLVTPEHGYPAVHGAAEYVQPVCCSCDREERRHRE